MLVRLAELRDLPELLDIYNYEVLNGYATFDSVPHTYEQRKVWFDEHNKDHHPLIVAVGDNESGQCNVSWWTDIKVPNK